MPTIGYDAEIILDGTGYFIKSGSYAVKQPRIRQASYRADGSLAYIDLGPGRRMWSMTVLAVNELRRYDGTLVGLSGQQFRDALHASYSGSIGATINLYDPMNSGPTAVHFDSYAESILNLHSQIIAIASGESIGASYEIKIELLEA
jgi:hypothetical protein